MNVTCVLICKSGDDDMTFSIGLSREKVSQSYLFTLPIASVVSQIE